MRLNSKRLLVLLGVVLVLSVLAAGCANTGDPVAVVNGEEISSKTFEEELAAAKDYYKQMGTDLDAEENKEQLAEVKEQVLDQLIDRTLLEQKIEEEGIEVSKEEVDGEISKIEEQVGGKEELDKILKEHNLNVDQLRSDIEYQLALEKLAKSRVDPVSEEEIQELYDQYAQNMENPESLENMRGEIEQFLVQQQREKVLIELVQELRDNAEIKKFLG
ncbi:MAG: SurA N-terminal domain-containing protein [Peptococcaceae bacterium]|nr:SurA N-terminal domain-containing protein [Peptococcaceae bacterium]